METLKIIVVISLKLLGMTSVFLATIYSPDVAIMYLASLRTTALPFFVKFFADIANNLSGMLQNGGAVNIAIASALVLTLLIGLISFAAKKVKGYI